MFLLVIQNIPFHTAAYYFGTKRKNKTTAKAHEYLIIWKKLGESPLENLSEDYLIEAEKQAY